MSILIENISSLVQIEDDPQRFVAGKQMAQVNTIKDAYLLIKDEFISDFGPMSALDKSAIDFNGTPVEILDASGRFVFPSFCDPHTHLVFAGSREGEFTDKIRGLSYEEIARRGGGILNSAKLLHDTSDEDLFNQSMIRIKEIIGLGTGAVEIKSGYGLNTEDELRMLRIIKRIKEHSPLEVKATFLGAHAIPAAYSGNRNDYIDIIINEMIPLVASEELADYIDVFCDHGF
ncbi:MAG: imidazolonepropionase, partial [Bacteroidales bacterium]